MFPFSLNYNHMRVEFHLSFASIEFFWVYIHNPIINVTTASLHEPKLMYNQLSNATEFHFALDLAHVMYDSASNAAVPVCEYALGCMYLCMIIFLIVKPFIRICLGWQVLMCPYLHLSHGSICASSGLNVRFFNSHLSYGFIESALAYTDVYV